VTDFPCNISTKENAQPEIEQQFSENKFYKNKSCMEWVVNLFYKQK